ncbi:hypothetical protein BDV26DRAFT_286185 [Aspergillus bertholletiae]|uniref:Xylanolytic transcriptional activator regulatory domain-containing protein n=1 Tax=Aspergillus bertholletiae TaxID=1226010 RepID=A0A5N7ATH5_9EURO|nr:hypothetical protein BDV26DRAFT_286185 [Aspergillus bertholletiae]
MTNCALVMIYTYLRSATAQGHAFAATGARSDVTEVCHVRIVPGRAGPNQGQQDTLDNDRPVPQEPKARAPTAPEQRSTKPWELLLNDGQHVHYVNNPNIKDLLHDEEHMRSTSTDPTKTSRPEHGVLGYGSHQLVTPPLSSLHHHHYPEPRDALQLWAIYVKNVDPVLKVLHIPTAQSAIIATILDPMGSGKSMSALIFAISFAALTSMTEKDAAELSWNRAQLLERFKFGLNHILVGRELLDQPELPALQALAIFLTSLRVHETGRGVWVLNGIAIRLARSIGLHRDGGSLNLSPFESELRLRVWWHLCILDSRSPEDHGFELTADLLNHGPRLPLNVNDDQLYPSMEELPTESEEWSEMSFCIGQIKVTRLLHPILGIRSKDTLGDIAAKRKTIDDYKNWLNSTLSSSSRPSYHLSHLACQHYLTACKKMEFMLLIREEIYRERQGQLPSGRDYSTKPSFKAACDVLNSSYHLLQQSGVFSQYTWLFKIYTQWYALAYVLRCLGMSSCTPETDRVWDLVNDILHCATNLDPSATSCTTIGNSSIWRCLCSLRAQALAARLAQKPHTDPDPLLPHLGSQEVGMLNDDIHNQHSPVLQNSQAHSTTTNALPARNPGDFSDSMEQPFEEFPEIQHGLFPAPSVLEVPCLPGWNAVINGTLDEGYF